MSDFTFSEPLPSHIDTECPVCYGILLEPHLNSCCGKHFCGSCIPKIKNGPCPLCKESTFTTLLDRSVQRQIKLLEVFCPNTGSGCKWVGEIALLEKQHRQECEYEKVKCEECDTVMLQMKKEDHLKESCPYVMLTCSYCSQKRLRKDMPCHVKICDRAPCDCPNGCGATPLTNKEIPAHVSSECPLQCVPCKFAKYGCDWTGKRQDLPLHVKDSAEVHLSCVMMEMSRREKAQEEKIRVLGEKVEKQDVTICTLQVLNDKLFQVVKSNKDEINELRTENADARFDFEYITGKLGVQLPKIHNCNFNFAITQFESRKKRKLMQQSRRFYSASEGVAYKLQIEVYPGGKDSGLGTHLGVFVVFLKDKRDATLPWPFRGYIAVRLIDQSGGRNHCDRKMLFSQHTDDAFKPIMLGKKKSLSYGLPQFISLDELNDRYVVNDTIQFTVTKIVY